MSLCVSLISSAPLNIRLGFTGLNCIYTFKDFDIYCLMSHKNYTHQKKITHIISLFVPILSIIMYEMFTNFIDEK